jgi:hypothetical protein
VQFKNKLKINIKIIKFKLEDIVQSFLKDYELKNYFLPIHCGSPDMANINLDYPSYHFIKNIAPLNNNNSSSLLLNFSNSNNEKQEELRLIKKYEKKFEINKKHLKSYLAGLFEGDGFI